MRTIWENNDYITRGMLVIVSPLLGPFWLIGWASSRLLDGLDRWRDRRNRRWRERHGERP